MLEKEMPRAQIIAIRVGSDPNDDTYRSYFDNAHRQVPSIFHESRRVFILSLFRYVGG